MRPYASFLVHVLTYLLVVGSFWAEAAVVMYFDAEHTLAYGWAVPLLVMTLAWGAGLLVHTFGALLNRGYDDVAV
ncbi:hypothetical protein GCM10027403_19990 [Arthrobacter tecti]